MRELSSTETPVLRWRMSWRSFLSMREPSSRVAMQNWSVRNASHCPTHASDIPSAAAPRSHQMPSAAAPRTQEMVLCEPLRDAL